MKKTTLAIIALAVLLLAVAGLAFAATRGTTDDRATLGDATPTVSPTPSPSPTPTVDTEADQEQEAATIIYSGNGFSQATVTVKAGSTVTVRNDSSRELDFASDIHPTHQENPELNIGTIAAGSSKTFTPQAVGSWGVHNHELQSHTMVLVVQ